MHARPTIIRNPPSDPAFEQAINEVLESGVVDAVAVQERLRERYPLAVVRPRALAGDVTPVWYVYREGRWIPDDKEGASRER